MRIVIPTNKTIERYHKKQLEIAREIGQIEKQIEAKIADEKARIKVLEEHLKSLDELIVEEENKMEQAIKALEKEISKDLNYGVDMEKLVKEIQKGTLRFED